MRDQKLHPAVARSRFGCQKHTIVGALLEVEPFKKCTRLWREAHFEFFKKLGSGAFLEVENAEMFTKCAPLWREARFQVKICQNGKNMQKHHMFGPLLDVQASFVWQAQWILHVVKGEPDVWAWHFATVSKTMAGVGHVTRACKDAFHLAGAVQETHESDMLDGQGAHFLRGILEHQIFGFAKIMSRHRCCSSSSWLNFSWQAQYLHMEWKHGKKHCYEAVRSALNFLFSTEVSQNCFVFDVLKFEN